MKTFSPTIILPAALALLISSTSTAEAQIRHRNSVLRGTQTKQKRRMAKSEKEKKGDEEEVAGGIETVEIAGIETTDTAMSAPMSISMSAPMSISFMSLPSVEVEEDEEEEKPKPPPPKPPSKKDDIESSPVTEEKSEFGKPLDRPEDETVTVVAPINTESSSVMQSTSSACIVGSLVAGAVFMFW